MISQHERHQFILNKLSKESFVNVLELCKELDVSSVTIRKDLKLLEDKQLLFHTHGGATINNPYTVDRPVNEKEKLQSGEKNKIADEAAQLIADNDSIIIASGTTVQALAKSIPTKKKSHGDHGFVAGGAGVDQSSRYRSDTAGWHFA